MNFVPQNEILLSTDYVDWCDYDWHEGDDAPGGIVNVDTYEIPAFFRKIAGNSQKYVVVSSKSDYGPVYQHQDNNLACFDMGRWLSLMMPATHGYNDATCPARINRDRSDINHRFSMKSWCHTLLTFEEVPDNVVQWFCTNSQINDLPNVSSIPYGINGRSKELEAAKTISEWNMFADKRTTNTYVNFSIYTAERQELIQYLSRCVWATVKSGVSFTEYLQDLATHTFTLCPNGNGPDCYRTLEALYMGSIPIIEHNKATDFWLQLQLPIIMLPTVKMTTPSLLNKICQANVQLLRHDQWDLGTISRTYWKNIIEEQGNKI